MSALHRAITAFQHNCRFDGTSMAPRRREHTILFGILDWLVRGISVTFLPTEAVA
jgi:hypothetical protein